MYKLTCLSMHHWYAFQAKDVPMNGTIGLIGRSGSGKSTIQDAILTVLLGANASQLSLNAAAAGKGGKAGDRNLKGYCLCSFFDVDEGAPQREVAETTLVLTFTHSITKRTVACGLMMTADKDEHEVTVDRMFVVTGLDFRFSDFLQMDAKGHRILPSQADIYARLKTEHAGRLQAFQTKTSYVTGLLTTLNPAGPPDASRFMKALSACRHLKEIGKPSEFVRRFVLEDSRLKVDAVRESIALWRELENDVEETRRKIDRLREVVSRNALVVRAQFHYRADSFRIADIDHRLAESRAKGLLDDISLREGQYEQATADLANANSDNDALGDRIREAERLRAADGSTLAIEALRRDRNRIAQGISQTYAIIKSRLDPFGKVHGARFEIDEGERRNLAAGVAASNQIRKAIATPDGLVTAITDGSLRREISKVKVASGSASEVEIVRDSRTRMRDDLEGRMVELRRRKEAAEAGHAYVPKVVEEMLGLLRAAGIHARVVSDLVKVNDPRWAMAVSLMLGQEETAILPQIEHVQEALRIHKLQGDHMSDCRILRTNRLRTETGTIKPGSLAEILETHDPDVERFIAQRLGSIMRVDSSAELMHHRMAITDDGQYASPLSVRKYRRVVSRIGRTDTRALMGELLAELNEVSEHHAEADEHARSAETLLQVLRIIQSIDLEALYRDIDGYMAQLSELNGAEQQLTAASQGVDEISELIQCLEGQIGDARRRRKEAEDRKEKVNGEIQSMRERHKQARTEADRHRTVSIEHLKGLQTPEAESAARHCEVEEDLWIPADPLNWIDARIPYGTTHEDWVKLLQGLRAAAETRQAQHKAGEKDQQRQAKHAWTQFVQAHPDEAKPDIVDEPTAILEHAIALRERVTRNVLIPFEQQVRDARRRMDDSLKEDLLAKMGDKLKATGNQIRDLNKLLTEKSYVGGYRYTFARAPSEEHKDIIDLVEAVQRNPGIGIAALLEDQSLSDGTGNLRRAMNQIEEMLRSGKDIDLIADHRRYFEYRIEALAPNATKARDFADLVGKLSGGEKEAPYYVAIAATMRSIYYPGLRAQSAPGFALVVLDEAFSKLDVDNTRKLIDHFSEMGLQLVIAAPDNNLSMFMQCTDSVVYIHRGESSPKVALEVIRPKPRIKEELRKRAPVYVESERVPGPVVPPYGMLA